MVPEELLEDITADLLSMRAHEACVRRLVLAPPGAWHRLDHICADDRALLDRLTEMHDAGSVFVTWLPFEQSAYGAGFCVVTFFSEPLG